jgi:hypothetical protein
MLVLALAAAPCVRAQRAKGGAGVRLVETGGFHGSEVRARTGETWLGLYVSEGRSALVPSVVKVTPGHDPVTDEPGQMTGKDVYVNRKPDPVFLIRGADALKPGPVLTSRAGETTLTKESDVHLQLAGEEYGLRVSTKDRRTVWTAEFLDDAKLVLSKGGVSQVIYELRAEGDLPETLGEGDLTETNEWKLLWAGDLDGDRRLDLYVQVSWHYNIVQHKLFLSSRAGANRLVREVAEFRISGC